jgi:hypothetical protein
MSIAGCSAVLGCRGEKAALSAGWSQIPVLAL